jgi:hypothetical protein
MAVPVAALRGTAKGAGFNFLADARLPSRRRCQTAIFLRFSWLGLIEPMLA